jgi:prefoldin subunit 5
MPLVLSPSFDDRTREEVEAHLEQVRTRRLAGAMEYLQSKMMRLEREEGTLSNKLARSYDQLGKALDRIDKDIVKVEQYLNNCQMMRTELDLTVDRISLAKRK